MSEVDGGQLVGKEYSWRYTKKHLNKAKLNKLVRLLFN